MTTQTDFSYEDVQRHVTEARRDRAKAQAAVIHAVGRQALGVARSAFQAMMRTGRTKIAAIRQARRRDKTIRALSGLSNDILKDIGLDRSEITSVANEVAYSPWPTRPASRKVTGRSEKGTGKTVVVSA